MKKIFILIVSLGLLYPDRPFAQNSIKLYPYQMPRPIIPIINVIM